MTDRHDEEWWDSRVWTNVYLNFPLTRRDRATLDAHLRSKETSISMRLREALLETLAEAGVSLPTTEHRG